MAKENMSLSELADVAREAAAIARQGGLPLGIQSLAVRAAGDSLGEIVDRIGRTQKEDYKNG